jgi:hypothetical protein
LLEDSGETVNADHVKIILTVPTDYIKNLETENGGQKAFLGRYDGQWSAVCAGIDRGCDSGFVLTMHDLNALIALVYNRLYSDSNGSAVRALLGAGASSVIHAKELSETRATDIVLPARPFIALRPGAIPTTDRVIEQPQFTWFVYDDPSQGYYRINAILPALATAYTGDSVTPLQLTTSAGIGLVTVDSPSQETQDDKLNLFVRFVRVGCLVF